jgi:hypothetical protein
LPRRLGKSFASSVIASVIALAQDENGREQPKVNETGRKRQIAGAARPATFFPTKSLTFLAIGMRDAARLTF